MFNDGILCISIAISWHGLLVLSWLLEMEPLMSLNLIRFKRQFQKPQDQFRKLIFKILCLWHHSQHWYLHLSEFSRDTAQTGCVLCVYRETYFKKMAPVTVEAWWLQNMMGGWWAEDPGKNAGWVQRLSAGRSPHLGEITITVSHCTRLIHIKDNSQSYPKSADINANSHLKTTFLEVSIRTFD